MSVYEQRDDDVMTTSSSAGTYDEYHDDEAMQSSRSSFYASSDRTTETSETSDGMLSSPPSPKKVMKWNHGSRYGLELLIGVRHPSAALSFDHGAYMIAKRQDEPFYRACFFFASSEIRFTHPDLSTALRQVFDLRAKGWTYMREPLDVYVTCHGTGLPPADGPFWRRNRYP